MWDDDYDYDALDYLEGRCMHDYDYEPEDIQDESEELAAVYNPIIQQMLKEAKNE